MLTSMFLAQPHLSIVVFCSLHRRLCESPSWTLPSSWYRRCGIVALAGTASHRCSHRSSAPGVTEAAESTLSRLDGLACRKPRARDAGNCDLVFLRVAGKRIGGSPIARHRKELSRTTSPSPPPCIGVFIWGEGSNIHCGCYVLRQQPHSSRRPSTWRRNTVFSYHVKCCSYYSSGCLRWVLRVQRSCVPLFFNSHRWNHVCLVLLHLYVVAGLLKYVALLGWSKCLRGRQ